MKRNRGARFDSTFLFLILFSGPLFIVPAIGGSAQFWAARQALAAVLVSLWAVAAIRVRGLSGALPRGRDAARMALFLALVWITGLLAHPPGGAQNRLLYFVLLFLAYALAANAPDRSRARRAAEAAVIAAGVILSIYGALMFFRVFQWVHYVDWGQRTASLFEDPNFFGIYMVFPLFWSLSRALTAERAATSLWMFAAAVICAAGLLLSNSRSAWLSFGIALPVLAVSTALQAGDAGEARRRVVALATFFVVLVAAGFFSGYVPVMKRFGFDPAQTVSSAMAFRGSESGARDDIHAAALEMIREHPLRGVGNFEAEAGRVQAKLGLGRLSGAVVVRRPPHAYNDYLTVAAVSGIPALLMYILLLVSVLAGAARNVVSARGVRDSCAAGYLAAAVAFIVQGDLYQSPLTCIPVALVFWMMAGLSSGEPERAATCGPVDGERAGVDDEWVVRYSSSSVRARAAGAVAVAVPLGFFVYYIGIAPSLGQYHYNKAFSYRNVGKDAEALAHVEKAMKYMPRDPFASVVRGDILMARGDMEGALKYYERGVKLFPYDAILYKTLGLCRAKRKEWAEAQKAFRAAVKYEPGSPAPLLTYVAAAALGAGDVSRAESILVDGISKYPKNPNLYGSLANLYMNTGRPEAAYGAAYQALQLDPRNPSRYLQLARILAETGNFIGARTVLFRALEIVPNDKRINMLLSQIPASSMR